LAKRGRMLGGKAPQRGGRLSLGKPVADPAPEGSTQVLIVLTVGFLILGIVAGFGWELDRQLRGGILLQRVEAVQRPDWVPLEALPEYVPRVFLAVVDPAFEGVGTLRSREDGSTLPRELVRQIHLLGNGLRGQARELVMGPVLEQRAGKQDLLEFYLNRVYLGIEHEVPIYGIHYAAREFFGKEASELTLGETATLAGLLLEPRIERPGERPGAAGVRRNEVLRSLAMAGLISAEEFAEAVAEPLGFQPGLTELPMSRRLPLRGDTATIRLPEQYRPRPEDEEEATD
jgi:membrane peptidoglycan carboxypeptidase